MDNGFDFYVFGFFDIIFILFHKYVIMGGNCGERILHAEIFFKKKAPPCMQEFKS